MKSFRQLFAVPVLALCAMLTLSACTQDDEPGAACQPTVALEKAISSRSGIEIAVDFNHAKQISYAVLQRAADATEPVAPTEADFKTIEVTALNGGKLVIPSSDLKGDGTYDIYAYGISGELKSKQISISVVVDSKNYAPMLSFEVKNISPYSLDVKVDATTECVEYVATVTRAEAYNAELFAEAAELSLHATEDQMSFGVQAYKPFYASALIPESQLLKDSRYDSQECLGAPLTRLNELGVAIEYVVAVYGVDKDGNGTVYQSEAFELPAAKVVEGPSVEAVPVTTYTYVLGTFTASKECVKVVYTALFTGDKGLDFWQNSDDKTIQDYLLTLPLSNAKPYTGTFSAKIPLNAQPGQEIVLVACGITADGSIGKFNYEAKPMRMPSFSGAAKPTSIEAVSSALGLMKWKIAVTPNAKKVRVFHTSQEFFSSTFEGSPAKELAFQWTMVTDESDNGYGFWTEYTAAELAANGGIYEIQVVQPTPGKEAAEYMLRVIASDVNGNWGEIVAGPNQTVLPEGEVDKTIDFSKGTGKLTVAVSNVVDNGDGCDLDYVVTYGENTKNVYWTARIDDEDYTSYADFTTDKLIATTKQGFDRDDVNESSLRVSGTTYTMTGMFYPSNWGTNFIILVTEDNAGNFRPAAAIIPDTTPRIMYLYN